MSTPHEPPQKNKTSWEEKMWAGMRAGLLLLAVVRAGLGVGKVRLWQWMGLGMGVGMGMGLGVNKLVSAGLWPLGHWTAVLVELAGTLLMWMGILAGMRMGAEKFKKEAMELWPDMKIAWAWVKRVSLWQWAGLVPVLFIGAKGLEELSPWVTIAKPVEMVGYALSLWVALSVGVKCLAWLWVGVKKVGAGVGLWMGVRKVWAGGEVVVLTLFFYGFGWLVYWAVGYFFPDVFSEVGTGLPDAGRADTNQGKPSDANGTDTSQEKPSELLRNRFWIVWMVGTTTFATAGIWFTNRARRNREKGLANEQQRLNSERFQRAVEMVANKDQLTTRLGGLYILRDLAKEDPEQEHIRCLDIVSDWLREKYPAPPKENQKKKKDTFAVYFQNSSIPQNQNKTEDGQAIQNSDYILAVFLFDQNKWLDTQKDRTRKYHNNETSRENYSYWPDLSYINFSHARMQGFDFKQSNLTKAILHGADLSGANLSDADLTGADLQVAHLNGAKLQWANLHGAKLQWAELQEAILRRADLTEAKLEGAIISGADLSNVKNLTREQLASARWVKPPRYSPITLPHDGTGSSDKK